MVDSYNTGTRPLEPLLEDLEARIDAGVEEALVVDWKRFWDRAWPEPVFDPVRTRKAPPRIEWPEVGVQEALDDPGAMLLQQLRMCSETLAQGEGAPLNIRCNYGTAILPSILGGPVAVMDPELNLLPTGIAHTGGPDGIEALIDAGVPDSGSGYGRQIFETARFMRETLAPYPKLAEHVHLYHPDLQGPMDACEMIWGSGIFYALLDEPARVHRCLDWITETYIAFMRRWEEVVPADVEGGSASFHWGFYLRGRIMLRDDSAMNLSPEMFAEFIRPYNERCLAACGGGADHFCGKGDHFIDLLTGIPGLTAVNLSQPHLNNMDAVFDATIGKGIPIVGLNRAAAHEALAGGRDLQGLVHIVTSG